LYHYYGTAKRQFACLLARTSFVVAFWIVSVCSIKGTHNADSIIESKVIYYLEQCGFGV